MKLIQWNLSLRCFSLVIDVLAVVSWGEKMNVTLWMSYSHHSSLGLASNRSVELIQGYKTCRHGGRNVVKLRLSVSNCCFGRFEAVGVSRNGEKKVNGKNGGEVYLLNVIPVTSGQVSGSLRLAG